MIELMRALLSMSYGLLSRYKPTEISRVFWIII